jgi:hypothetical protein
LQREQAFLIRDRRVRKLAAKRFDLVDDAARSGRLGGRYRRRQRRMAEALGIEVGLRHLDVDEVPFARRAIARLTEIAVRVPKPIRPCGLTRERGVGGQVTRIGREQGVDLLPHRWREELRGDQAHHFVTLVTPGCGTTGQQQTEQNPKPNRHRMRLRSPPRLL